NQIIWDIRLLDTHGVENYPFGNDGIINLKCEKRNSISDEPVVTVKSNKTINLIVKWGKQKKIVTT
ncbi:MAG TPA: hypothetical protein P5105_03120, partial [Victivallales bacterium]|nr:hypothetical protein [Victivallales bacterium]